MRNIVREDLATGLRRLYRQPKGKPPQVVQRRVRRIVCSECGHLKSEHSREALCGTFRIEHITLPVCVECRRRVCECDEDEMCQVCFRKQTTVRNVSNHE